MGMIFGVEQWTFSMPNFIQSVHELQYGPPKIDNFTNIFFQILKYNCPHRGVPLHVFHEICRVFSQFQEASIIKIWRDSLNRLQSYGGFKLSVRFPQIFSTPSGDTMRWTPTSTCN